MSLEKAIEHGKERRRQYRKSKAFDKTCRNHGDCPWCHEDRTHKNKIRQMAADEELKEWKNVRY